MTVAVFFPTRRFGGIDLTVSSLLRQTYSDFVWIVQDELMSKRHRMWGLILDSFPELEIEFLTTARKEGNHRNLAASYNRAARYSLEINADYFVSLQDYIWIPDNGLEMFLEVHDAVDRAIVTGLTSHSAKPTKDDIVNFYGNYTIFAEPLTEKPEGISWSDVRAVDLYPEDEFKTIRCMPEHWEANWASVDMKIIADGARWDEEYDRGVAYENIDFAKRAVQLGASCILDKRNHAISLPHKEYFDGEKEEVVEHSNRELYERKWMR